LEIKVTSKNPNEMESREETIPNPGMSTPTKGMSRYKIISGLKGMSSKHKYMLTVVIYLLALLAAEFTTSYINKSWGLAMHVVILFALIINSSLVSSPEFANLLRALIAVPIIRIIGMSMPLIQIDPFFWFPIVAIPLFAASLVISRSQGLGWKDVGLTLEGWPWQILIGLLGLFFGLVEYLILRPEPLIPSLNFINLLGGFIVILISTGLAEELLFRGIIQGNAQKIFKPLFAILFTALVFTTMHMGWMSVVDYIFVFSVAIFYGVIFYKTNNIVGITLNHGLSNTMLFLILPFFTILPGIGPF
jgi:membrane protease YdiL (CAAX protease family)